MGRFAVVLSMMMSVPFWVLLLLGDAPQLRRFCGIGFRPWMKKEVFDGRADAVDCARPWRFEAAEMEEEARAAAAHGLKEAVIAVLCLDQHQWIVVGSDGALHAGGFGDDDGRSRRVEPLPAGRSDGQGPGTLADGIRGAGEAEAIGAAIAQ